MSFKRILVFVIALTLISGLTLFGAKVKKGAEIKTMKGHIVKWKDVKKIKPGDLGKDRRMRPVLNFESPRNITKNTNTIDPVAQTSATTSEGLTRHEALIPDTSANFEGMNLANNGNGIPPDTNGDVGSTYFIQTVNTSIGIYNKSTGALVSATTFDNFFGGTGITGTPCDADNNGDPIVLYDQYQQRWFILDFAWDPSQSDGSYYSIAASKTSDPTGDWWQYAFRADNTLMNDYPKCGVWHDGIYITANMFQFSGSYQHVKIWALKTPDLYNGTLTSQSLIDTSDQAWSIMPANAKGSTAPPTSSPCYMFSIDADEYGGGAIDGLYMWKYDVDWTNSANTTWTGHTTMNVAAYGLTASDIPQQGTTNTLDSLYGRLMFPAFYRNWGTYEAVYLVHVCEYNSTRQNRWYEVRLNSGTPSIYQQGTYAPDSDMRWMAAIGADKNGNIGMGYSTSSSSMYPSIRYTGRTPSDTLGTMGQGEGSIIEGTAYQSNYERWGDYSSISIDPDDDETFWYTTEYLGSNGYYWQTRIGAFKVQAAPDTTPPVISNVQAVNVTDVAATITWTTDENANSEVQYGLTTSYGSSESDSAYVKNHSITLTGLTNNTTYHYKVVSVDPSTNSAQSTDYTFTTLNDPPPNPDIFVDSITMTKDKSANRYRANATITIKDTNGDVVPNATVYVSWSGSHTGTDNGITDANGQVTFTTPYIRKATTFTVTVTNVTHATNNYDSSLNNETSDSI